MATTRGELGDKLSSLSLFADLSAACQHAMRIALEVACKYPRRPGELVASVPLALEVMDHRGAMVFRTPIR